MGVALEDDKIGLAQDRGVGIINGLGQQVTANLWIIFFGQQTICQQHL